MLNVCHQTYNMTRHLFFSSFYRQINVFGLLKKSLKWTEWPISSKYIWLIQNLPLISSFPEESNVYSWITQSYSFSCTNTAFLFWHQKLEKQNEKPQWNGCVISRPCCSFPLIILLFVIPQLLFALFPLLHRMCSRDTPWCTWHSSVRRMELWTMDSMYLLMKHNYMLRINCITSFCKQ